MQWVREKRVAMKLNKGQIIALLILFLLVIAAVALLRDEAMDLLNIEGQRIIMPSN